MNEKNASSEKANYSGKSGDSGGNKQLRPVDNYNLIGGECSAGIKMRYKLMWLISNSLMNANGVQSRIVNGLLRKVINCFHDLIKQLGWWQNTF